ncbi:MAG: hypothetical protein AAF291_00255 [Pseudomonadota bacterium]
MLKSIIGASIGSHLTKKPAAGGALGATLATAAPFVLSRISLPTMAALGLGGFLVKRHLDKKKAEEASQDMERISGVKVAKPTEAPDADTGSVIDPPPGGAINGAGAVSAARAAT